jgi:hypothetical protein
LKLSTGYFSGLSSTFQIIVLFIIYADSFIGFTGWTDSATSGICPSLGFQSKLYLWYPDTQITKRYGCTCELFGVLETTISEIA